MIRRTYYEILGVRTDAGVEEIKAAYREVARTCHPDQNPDASAHERFKAANEAWRVLRDEDLRRRYDRNGEVPAGSLYGAALPPRNPVFEFVRSVASNASRTLRARRGEDITLDVTLSLCDAARGCTRVFELPRRVDETDERAKIEARRLAFPLPAGVVTGQILRWRGEGAPGSFGASSGDLYVKIEVASESWWRIEGADLHATLPVTPLIMVLGGMVDVPSLDGVRRVAISPGCRVGDTVRVPRAGAGPEDARGDLVLSLTIELPEDPDDELVDALRVLHRAADAVNGPATIALRDALARARAMETA